MGDPCSLYSWGTQGSFTVHSARGCGRGKGNIVKSSHLGNPTVHHFTYIIGQSKHYGLTKAYYNLHASFLGFLLQAGDMLEGSLHISFHLKPTTTYEVHFRAPFHK